MCVDEGKLIFSLGKYNTVLQEEMYATKICTVENADRGYKAEVSIICLTVKL
jgi:hypothetical protein